jgi:dipeptidyl aminopeptidase/acylaminoacyl peptidase
MRRRLLAPLLAAALAAGPSLAQAGAGLPLEPARTLSLDVHGGSWMSLDVSPDGLTILFDMLGDLYAMPVRGGEARQITRGLAFDTQAVFSPDGAWIAFVSDRSGAENLWIARPDGGQARQVTDNQDDTVLVSPEWSADGQALFASRFRPDLNNYELWRFGLDGTKALIAPVKPSDTAPRSAWRSTLGASASRDGRFLYLARRVGGLNFDDRDAWIIVRRDLATDAETAVISGSGGRGAEHGTFFRPRISPDGRVLAYIARVENRDELRVRDLQTGLDRLLASNLDPDQLQASAWQDLAARYAFTPDSRAILLSRGNGIERIEIADGRVTPEPFEAHMQVDVGPSTRQHIREETGLVRARLAQHAIASPDGTRIAFSALGDLYVQPLKGGTARRLGPGSQPSWSPDGRRLVYVTWTEAEGGAVWTIAADGSGPPTRISDIAASIPIPSTRRTALGCSPCARRPRRGCTPPSRSASAAPARSWPSPPPAAPPAWCRRGASAAVRSSWRAIPARSSWTRTTGSTASTFRPAPAAASPR